MYKIHLESVNNAPFALCVNHMHQDPTLLHFHDCIEIVIILAGSGIHLTENGRQNVSAGDILIIYPGLKHQYVDVENFELINILFRQNEIIVPLLDLYKLPGYNQLFGTKSASFDEKEKYPHIHASKELFKSIKKLGELMREEQVHLEAGGHRCCMTGYFMALLTYVVRSYTGVICKQDKKCKKIEQTVTYLKKHFAEEFDLRALQKIAAMSKSTLMRRFQAVTGMTPLQYVLQLRIFHACQMLHETGSSVSEIALDCGFCDSSHFAKVFRKVTGVAPSEFRRKNSSV